MKKSDRIILNVAFEGIIQKAQELKNDGVGFNDGPMTFEEGVQTGWNRAMSKIQEICRTVIDENHA